MPSNLTPKQCKSTFFMATVQIDFILQRIREFVGIKSSSSSNTRGGGGKEGMDSTAGCSCASVFGLRAVVASLFHLHHLNRSSKPDWRWTMTGIDLLHCFSFLLRVNSGGRTRCGYRARTQGADYEVLHHHWSRPSQLLAHQ